MNEQSQNIAQDFSANQHKLYAALAKAQGAFQAIEKNRSVTIKSEKGQYQFRYADLEEILSKTRPALSSNGLAMIQRIDNTNLGPVLTCMLMHADGGSLVSEVALPSMRDMGDPKRFGATLTYLRRYMVTAMLGVAADDDLDDDGEEIKPSENNKPTGGTGTKPAVSMPQRKQVTQESEQQTEGQLATAGEIAYMTKKLEGRQDAQEICDAHGVQRSLDGLTKSQFAALKAALV